MKPALLVAILGGALLWAQEDDAAPDPIKLLNKLMQANAAKDLTSVGVLLKDIGELGTTSKNAEEVDPLAKELATSLKLAKGNWGLLKKIVATMGELHSKKAEATLKRLAFKKRTKNEDEQGLQAAAIEAVAMLRNARNVKSIGDMCKSRSLVVAKAAYVSFKHYGASPGKVRKGIAEILMKRLQAEKPSQGKQGSGNISKEQQERWSKLERVIVQSMQVICRQDTIIDVATWQDWWKENKRNPKAWRDEKKE